MSNVEYLIIIPIAALIYLVWYFGKATFNIKDSNITDELTGPEKLLINIKISDSELKSYIETLIGKKIEQVYYINLNTKPNKFNDFDSFDFGVIIKFAGNHFLNWLYHDGIPNQSTSEYIHEGYYIDFSDHLSGLKGDKNVFNVSKDPKWVNIINTRVKNLSINRIDIEGSKVCEKIIIESETGHKAGIFSVAEPDIENRNTLNVNLDFDVQWIIVLFDEKYLKSD